MAVWEYANALARRGHEVHVVHDTILGEPVESLDDVTWFEFDERLHHHFGAPEDLDGHRSDFVFCLFRAAPAELGLPLMWVQAIDAFPPFVEKTIFGATCPKLCTSTFIRDVVIDRGVDPRQAVHLPYGIRHDKYRVTRALDDRPPAVAMLYNPHEMKGPAVGLAAIVAAKQRVPELEAHVFGVGPRPDLPDWIDYVQDPPQAQLVDQIYNGSRIFVLPSRVEGFGLAAVEAMASGCALVSTDCGGSNDYAHHGDTALVSPPGDVDAMADHLVSLLLDDQARCEMSARSVAFVQRFDWDRSAEQLETFLTTYADDPAVLQQPAELVPWPE